MSWKVTINVPTKVGDPITATVNFEKGWTWDGSLVKDGMERFYVIFFEPDVASPGGSVLVDLKCVLFASGTTEHDIGVLALTVDSSATPAKKELRAYDRKTVRNGHA